MALLVLFVVSSLSEPGHLSYSSDVYSLGVVMMELITGKDASNEARGFVLETRQKLEAALKEETSWNKVLDPCMNNDYDMSQVRGVTSLTLACTSPESKSRPKMPLLIDTLKVL